MALTTAAAATAATILGGMYLDAKLLVSHDISNGMLSVLTNAAQKFTQQRFEEDRMTIYHDLESHAKSTTNGKNVFLVFEGQSWTYAQFFADLQRVGNWLMNDLGIERQEIVALNGPNSPEYLLMWFALEAIGACPAFVNCNLTAGSLTHCINLAQVRYMLADKEVKKLVEGSEEELKRNGCQIHYYSAEFIASLTDTTEISGSRRSKIQPTDTVCLMYTSGTTGLPKGIKMLRLKELNTARTVALYLKLKPGNRMYTCLPLYHGAAHGLCITPTIYAGSTVILSRKFSHKTFWPEVRDSQADILQYVGELCRYLINAPLHPLDKKHSVKSAWGNGMRPDVWENFRQRFGIETIIELYAATDGMGGSFNRNRGDFGRNAIAKRGYLWNKIFSQYEKRIKIDPVTQEIVRDRHGFAIECELGEPGEVVHMMLPAMEKIVFAGYYNNDEASEKRKIRGLFKEGDIWFRSGDMMRQDPDGCVYFVDRLGDTFRWKSENVSTNEVGDVMGSFDQIAEANVYGVQVPNHDGRCGCAAVVLADGVNEDQLNLSKLATHGLSTLPRYAVPRFIRVVKALQYTGTMKLQKGTLREEGIDPDKTSSDAMFWLPPGQTAYIPYKRKDWEAIKTGKVKL